MPDDASPPALGSALARLMTELLEGPVGRGGYVLNVGDAGLLGSLDRITASAAATRPETGNACIAAHVDHVRYSLSLMNRWMAGEANPWATADWGRSWTVTVASDAEWAALVEAMRDEARRWVEHLAETEDPTPASHPVALRGAIGSVVHLAYHLGAIRQLDAGAAGPRHGEV